MLEMSSDAHCALDKLSVASYSVRYRDDMVVTINPIINKKGTHYGEA